MFGYVRPYTPELKVRENELYNAVYCGLCKSMGKTTGAFSRLTLSYDIVFLALVRSALTGARFEIIQGRCGFHPFKKKNIASDCDTLRYCSAVSAELSYRDLTDKINDSKGIKKLYYRLLLPSFGKKKKRAEKTVKFDGGFIEETLGELYNLQTAGEPSPDRAADVFGRLLEYFFSFGMTEELKQSAAVIGRNTGRFIYLCDAADDLEKDEKSGSYNPLLLSEGEKNEKLNRAFAAMCIWADTAAAELALESRPSPEADTAENILRLGMPDTAKKTTEKKGKKNGKRSV